MHNDLNELLEPKTKKRKISEKSSNLPPKSQVRSSSHSVMDLTEDSDDESTKTPSPKRQKTSSSSQKKQTTPIKNAKAGDTKGSKENKKPNIDHSTQDETEETKGRSEKSKQEER